MNCHARGRDIREEKCAALEESLSVVGQAEEMQQKLRELGVQAGQVSLPENGL